MYFSVGLVLYPGPGTGKALMETPSKADFFVVVAPIVLLKGMRNCHLTRETF